MQTSKQTKASQKVASQLQATTEMTTDAQSPAKQTKAASRSKTPQQKQEQKACAVDAQNKQKATSKSPGRVVDRSQSPQKSKILPLNNAITAEDKLATQSSKMKRVQNKIVEQKEPVEEESKRMTKPAAQTESKPRRQTTPKKKGQNEKQPLEGYLGPMPRKALTGYMFFIQEIHHQIAQENPDKSMTELSSVKAALWSELDESKRQHYLDLAAKDKERVETQKREREEFGYFTMDDKSLSIDPKNMHLFKPNHYEHDLELQKKPKNPHTSYNYFHTEQAKIIKQQDETVKLPQVSQIASQQWQNLTDEERVQYVELAEQDRIRHHNQLAELHRYGFYTLQDGSKSTDEQNRPPKKRQAKMEEKEAEQNQAVSTKKNAKKPEANLDEQQDLAEAKVNARKRKSKSTIEDAKVAK